ncbi:hypothetical protein ACFL54_05535 [Planctomycetota bacterium]
MNIKYFILAVLLFIVAFVNYEQHAICYGAPQKVQLVWQAEIDTAYFYDQFKISSLDQELKKSIPPRILPLYPMDIQKDGRGASFLISSVEALSLAVLQTLPEAEVSPGKKWTTKESAFFRRQVHAQSIYFERVNLACAFHFISIQEKDNEQLARIQFKGKTIDKNSLIYAVNVEFNGFFLFDLSTGRIQELRALVNYQKITYEGENRDKTKKLIPTSGGIALRFKQRLALHGPTFDKMNEAAIEECVQGLIKKQQADGYIGDPVLKKEYPMGATALSLLALLKAGVSRENEVIKKSMNYLRSLPLQNTYSVAMLCMALEAFYTPLAELKITEKNYEQNSLEKEPRKLSTKDLARMRQAANWLVETQSVPGAWTYVSERKYNGPSKSLNERYDHSNSQYAVLGLYAAARCGVYIQYKHWQAILNHWLETQEKKGEEIIRVPQPGEKQKSSVAIPVRGWNYVSTGPATLTMTTGGVASVAIAYACLNQIKPGAAKKLRFAAKYSIDCGLAWLEKNALLTRGIIQEKHDTYYLYGYERALVINGLRFLGGRNWYREGSAFLCVKAKFKSINPNIISRWGGCKDTAFVLLFLKRATAPIGVISGEE